MPERALAPVIAVVLLVAMTVALAAVVAVIVGSVGSPHATPQASIGGTIDTATNEVVLEHLGGDDLNLARIELLVRVDDDPLEKQPPVPFFAAPGFAGGPTGPFNSATDDTWSPGERGGFRIAGTNDPLPNAGATVTVSIRHEDAVIATVELSPA